MQRVLRAAACEVSGALVAEAAGRVPREDACKDGL